MSDSGGGGTPTSTPAAATPGPADGSPAAPTPAAGPRRAAPGLSTDRGGMSLSQGIAALRRGGTAAPAAPAATPAAEGDTPAAPQRRPATRPAPNTVAAEPADAGQQQQQQRQTRQAAPASPASPLDAVMAAFLPQADGTPQSQRGAEMQPAPVNAYLQGVPLRIGNEERNFTLPELTEAVGKAHDYTRKTAALAEQQRALNERAQTIDQLLPVLIPEIERQLEALNGGDAEPDWHAIPAPDHPRIFAEWRTRQRANETERGRLAQIMQANQQRDLQQRAERVRISHERLVRTVPGWSDANTRGQLVAEMRTWGGANGFPSAELDSIVESRHIETLLKAMMFDKIMASTRTNTLTVPQVRRGSAPPPPAPAAIHSAEERFHANPTNKTGVGLLLARRGQGRMNGRH